MVVHNLATWSMMSTGFVCPGERLGFVGHMLKYYYYAGFGYPLLFINFTGGMKELLELMLLYLALFQAIVQ